MLSLLINKEHSEVIDPTKYYHEMEVTMGVVYLLLPLVSGKVDWCSIKFSASQVYEASNKDTKHCHSCKEVNLLQTKDGPLCRCMLESSIVCTPHNMELYAVTGFLELNATSLLHLRDGRAVTYLTYFKTRYKFVLSVLFCVHLFL
jgi:endoribonuclease Dicer